PLKRNQFGGTIGGPVVIPGVYHGKDKTFFFFGYQGTRIRTASERTNFVPTLAKQAGNFSPPLSATKPDNPFGRVVVINDPVTGQPFQGNIIDSSRFDPAAVAFFKYLPSVGGSGLVRFSQPSRQDFNAVLARVDHALSGKDRLTARYYL